MSVRWKPLLVLSGLFLVVGVVGVTAIMISLSPRSAQGLLVKARAARESGRYEDADIYYKQALQLEPRNGLIHEEMAGLYEGWSRAKPERAQALATERMEHLASAIRADRNLKGPRLALLREMMERGLRRESLEWAKEVLRLDAGDPDANYVMAVEELEQEAPRLPEVRRWAEALERGRASGVRRLWVRARLADAAGDRAERDRALAGMDEAAAGVKDDVDRMALLRLAALAATSEQRPEAQQAKVERMLALAAELGTSAHTSGVRAARIRQILANAQKQLTTAQTATPGQPASPQLRAIEQTIDSLFQRILASSAQPDLETYLSYADHLRVTGRADKCQEIVAQALSSPLAAKKEVQTVVMGLHAVAVEAALFATSDRARFDKAAPHIEALLAATDPRYQGMGHLFAGSIDLERSGAARGETNEDDRSARLKCRASALEHLRIAAERLPDMAEAQARYGVALVLAGEQNLGRQYLSRALRQGRLDGQYQLWAAWTMLQAGYPEEAEPIVRELTRLVEAKQAPGDLAGTLHLLAGEIHQARRTPEELKAAMREFQLAGQAKSNALAGVVLRQAQIEAQLGQREQALARLDEAKARGLVDPGLEQLAVLLLEEAGKKGEARARLAAARRRFPGAADLVGLEATLLVKDGQGAEADRLLASFLAGGSAHETLVLLRAHLLAETLGKPDEARKILAAAGETSESSAPLVQLAGLEIASNRLDAAEAVVRRIRDRFHGAAAADVLQGQIALKRNRRGEALECFTQALQKDPDNKIVQFWKAELDSEAGQVEEAARTFEDLVRARPVKEVDTGTSLLTAAQAALANLSLKTGAVDEAVRRFEELKKSRAGGKLTRPEHWQLVAAYATKGDWPSARREIADILNDRKNPASEEDRVRGANYYRTQGETAAALAQLDYVLSANPAHPTAAVSRAYILLKQKQYQEAADTLRKALSVVPEKGKPPHPPVLDLMLAAVENETPPRSSGIDRAIAVLDRGLERWPDSLELAEAKYTALVSKGQPAEALRFIEGVARNPRNKAAQRYLAQVYRDRGEYTKAADQLRALRKDDPEDPNLGAALVQMIALEAGSAAAQGQAGRSQALLDQAVVLLRELRKKDPRSLVYLQAECDLAARQGDFNRAIEITRTIDELDRTTTLGAMLRARLSALAGKTEETAAAYEESVKRNPRQLDVRILLGRTRLALGQYDRAIEQARLVQAVEKDRADAVLLEARALAGSKEPGVDGPGQAVAKLRGLIKSNPGLGEAYRVLAEIESARGKRAEAIEVLRTALEVNPADAAGAGQLIELLAGPGAQGDGADLTAARQVAEQVTAGEGRGEAELAVSLAFEHVHRLDLALPYAERAARKLDAPAAHLSLGDILLSMAESQPEAAESKSLFQRAIAEYDKVLTADPGSIAAANNKAWILHTHLGQSQKALAVALAIKGRLPAATLPGEFLDTLGSIQEAVGRKRDAEEAYRDGLRKAPDHPVLNFHYGRLIAADPAQAKRAKDHLVKAAALRDRLSPRMAQETDRLLRLLDRAKTQN